MNSNSTNNHWKEVRPHRPPSTRASSWVRMSTVTGRMLGGPSNKAPESVDLDCIDPVRVGNRDVGRNIAFSPLDLTPTDGTGLIRPDANVPYAAGTNRGQAGLIADEQSVSTWRQVLAENWEEMRALTDWMGIPAMHDHVAELHTGHPRSVGGDWVDHSLHRHLRPLAERLAAADLLEKLPK